MRSALFIFSMGLITIAAPNARAEGPVAPPGVYRLDDKSDGSACTAVAITPDGILLTALHCLRNCLRSQGRMETASSNFIGLTELDVATNPQQPAFCSQISLTSLGTHGVKVLATGVSLVQYAPPFLLTYPSYFKDLQSRGFDAMNEDYAVIQIAVPPPACGKLSSVAIPPNGHLAALGFQQQDDQPSVLIYNETPGFRYTSAAQSAYSKLSLDVAGTPDFAKYVSQLFDHPDVIYASAPIKEGQSGGPVINDQRQIAGLVSGHTNDGQGVSELFAVPLQHIMDKLPVGLAESLRTKNAGCHSIF